MRIVWLCHFANQEIKDYFNTPNINEFAPWISNTLNHLKSASEIEIHIVAPNVFTNTNINFKKDGIYYHFYRHRNKFIHKKIYNLKSRIFENKYKRIKKRVKNIIGSIKPDLIHLHGAENPYYASAILPLIGKYPILCSIQGFIRHSIHKELRKYKSNIRIEETIIKNCTDFGTRTKAMNKTVLKINSSARLHFHRYYINYPNDIKDNIGDEKENIDVVFFARICRDKGVEDLLSAISLLKKRKLNPKVHIIGATSNSYKALLEKQISSLNISDNIDFVRFIPTQSALYRYLKKAKICVLPTYHDIIPGTIVESMLMKLAVIAYNTGSIPEVNLTGNHIVIVEKYNIVELANAIEYLLKQTKEREKLAEKAYNYAINRFSNKEIKENLIKAYKSVIDAYSSGKKDA